ncbi:hypothetical protein ACFL2Q_06370, partial [Thermodesulfobacteriota bacterium]
MERELFQSEEFQSWSAGEYTLYLFLDSLDEFLVSGPRGLTILIDRLAGYPLQRLRLRILCRSGNWPADLEDRLGQMWNESSVGKFTLEPLS